MHQCYLKLKCDRLFGTHRCRCVCSLPSQSILIAWNQRNWHVSTHSLKNLVKSTIIDNNSNNSNVMIRMDQQCRAATAIANRESTHCCQCCRRHYRRRTLITHISHISLSLSLHSFGKFNIVATIWIVKLDTPAIKIYKQSLLFTYI
jgi:hypothetical protein